MQETNQQGVTIKDEITLREIILKLRQWFRFLLDKKKLIILFAAIGGIIGLACAFLIKPLYNGQLTFVLENNGKAKGGVSSIAAQFGLSMGGASTGIFQGDDNVIAFLQSRNMIVRTLLSPDVFSEKNQLLVDRFIAFNDYRDTWKKNPNLHNLQFEQTPIRNKRLQDSLLTVFYKQILEENLSVDKPDKKNDVIAISIVTPDQYFSKAFAEELLNNAREFYIETQTKKSKENVDILRMQVDSIRALLNLALVGAASTNDANPNMNPAFQRLRVPSQKKLVDVEMNKAILEELVKQLELSEITLRKETPLIQVIDEPVIPMKPKKLGKIKGTVTGIFLGGLIIVLFISIREFFKKVMTGTSEIVDSN